MAFEPVFNSKISQFSNGKLHGKCITGHMKSNFKGLGTPTAERPLEQLCSKSRDSRYLLSATGPLIKKHTMKTQEAKAKYTRPFYLCNSIVKNYSLLSKKNISQCSARTAQNTKRVGK